MNTRTAKAAVSIKKIERQIHGLVRELSHLAPNPHAPSAQGPAFISLNNVFKPAAEYEGMMGSLLLDGFLGTAFADAANDNALSSSVFAVDNNMLEAAAQYMEERSEDHKDDKTHNNFGHGRGSIALYERTKTSMSPFNLCAQDNAIENYRANLGARMKLESHIAERLRAYNDQKAVYELHVA